MIGAVWGVVFGGLKKFIGGFIVLCVVVYIAAKYSDAGLTGSAAVHQTGNNVREMATAILGETVKLIKALWATVVANL